MCRGPMLASVCSVSPDPMCSPAARLAGRPVSGTARGSFVVPGIVRLGTLEVDLQRRELRRGNAALVVGSVGFEILETLIRAQGAVVEKDRMVEKVWPGQT